MTIDLTKQTEAVLAHHLQALGSGQLDATLSDYVEESVLFTVDGTIKGLAAIRAFFDNFIKTAPPGFWEAFAMLRQDVHGEVAYIYWKAQPFVTFATDTFVVRDGKFIAQSFTPFAAP